jgi:hypothetical protein
MIEEKRQMPNYVDRPARGEFAVQAHCISNTGSKALHRFSVDADAPLDVGALFEFGGKLYRVVRVDSVRG